MNKSIVLLSSIGTFSISNGLGFLVDDYALNQSYSFVTLPGTNSNEISFKIAAALAFKAATPLIKPTILEPVMEVVVTVKDEYVGEELKLYFESIWNFD